MTNIINQSQASFIPGKNICDHILLAYEMICGYSRKGGTPRCILQLDIQKSYDIVDWYVLENILKEFGFPKRFTRWVVVVVSIVSYRFNIRGVHTSTMKSRRGLRQGDPMYHLLFVIMMEYLHSSVHKLS
ncbi:uncharacterized protein LOC127121998 [Lathyrus oleraceus]|uniref:uncharacterized protein LOC127121998 n=1 Tax=Pisum sativum TaxID=3888 RepID=UPI0021CE5DCE|nr:uncharacterized protein LOC127121998 [Pisum sativum]